jgi:hypothetical protein
MASGHRSLSFGISSATVRVFVTQRTIHGEGVAFSWRLLETSDSIDPVASELATIEVWRSD